MTKASTIELFKENMKFSAGHFTVFSSTERENLHGHNYTVYAAFTTLIEDEGLTFDYRFYKEKMRNICNALNRVTLIPESCKYLRIEETPDYYNIYFNNEKIIFTKRDVKILPVTNITVEELSHFILAQLLFEKNELTKNRIQKIKIKVFSGPGQSGSATWRNERA